MHVNFVAKSLEQMLSHKSYYNKTVKECERKEKRIRKYKKIQHRAAKTFISGHLPKDDSCRYSIQNPLAETKHNFIRTCSGNHLISEIQSFT